jgi:hypothetical protein
MLHSRAQSYLKNGVAAADYYSMSAAASAAPQSQAPTSAQIKNANMQARQAIVQTALRRQQQIYTNTFNPTSGVVLNIQPQYVGLILGFWVDVQATFTTSTAGYDVTQWGPANLIQQVVFNDLSNNTRISTTGWHLNAINTAKQKRPFESVTPTTAYPVGYGNTFTNNVAVAPSPTTGSGGNLRMLFWVPLSYSEMDLRGAMWANVVNATAQLQLTMATSAQAFVAATADPTNAVYQVAGSAAGGTITSYTVTVHQVYYDQLPVDKNGNQILPIVDLSTLYMLQNTSLSSMTVGNDFPVPYANFRSFLSTLIIYDNQASGVYPAAGSDVNYWTLQTANFTNIFKYPGWFPTVYARDAIHSDFPLGAYYFPTRSKPINTIQYGNQQIIGNFSTVNAGAALLVGWEMFAVTNTLIGAASLAGGG